jgi:hypothetical protein
VRPHPPGRAPAGLHLVEQERHVEETGQEPEAAHEPGARHAHAALALDGLDQDRGDAAGARQRLIADRSATLAEERVQHPIRVGEERVDRVQLLTEALAPSFRFRITTRGQEVPEMLEAPLLAPGGLPGVAVRGGERNVRPVECGETEARLLAVRHREAAQRAAVESALERHDDPAARLVRGLHAIEQHRLDRVLHRLGAGIDHEVSRGPGRGDLVEPGLEPQRQGGLVLGVRVARDGVGEAPQQRRHDARVVLAEGLGRDERSHVDEPVGFAGGVAVHGGEVGTDRSCRVEGHRERVEETLRGRLERGVRGRQAPADEVVERFVATQVLGNVDVDLTAPIARVHLVHPLQVGSHVRTCRFEFAHRSP